jgi:hypothetical protein
MLPMSGPRSISPEVARDALVKAGITGPHRSHSRRSTLGKIEPLIEGDPDKTFGLSGMERVGPADVLAAMAKLTGCDADLECLDEDRIDPDLTMAGIISAAQRLADHARRGGTLLVATGHPTGMLEHNIRVADAFANAGGKLLRPREGEKLRFPSKPGREYEVRYTGGVGCLADWGQLKHTHYSYAMEALLEEEPWPEMVFADHGFAGAAIEREIPTIAVMDINDHALAVAWADGRDVTIVPMDDNRPPRLYEPSWRLFEQIIRSES